MRVTGAIRGLVIGMVLVAGCPGVEAQETAREVRFCFSEWPPYAFRRDGAIDGLSVRVLREAADRIGITARFVERPWKRCLSDVRTGELDAVLDAAKREEFLQGPVSFSSYSNTFWVRDDSPLTGFSLDSFTGRSVGIVSGYSYPDALKVSPPFIVDLSADEEIALRKLAAGRLDAVVADLVSTAQLVDSRKLPIRPLLPSHSVDPLYPSFNRELGELQARFDAELARLRANGFIDALYAQMLELNAAAVLDNPE